MIKWIHQNKRSLAVFLVLSAVVLSMSLFGVDLGNNTSQQAAIKIDDSTVTFEEFYKEKSRRQQQLIDQYKRMLGDKFNQFARNIYNIPGQQIVDAMISHILFRREAHNFELRPGVEETRAFIKQNIFGGNFDANLYQAYLMRLGISSRAFESQLQDDLLVQQYQDLLREMSRPSEAEVRRRIVRDETTYSVESVEFDPARYLDKVKDVEDAKLEEFYQDHQTDYEIPARLSYRYIVFDPLKFINLVEVAPEEIEMFYADNEAHFTNPEAVKALHITIGIPNDADDARKAEIKARAEEVHAKATAGEDFVSLVAQYSDDLATMGRGGDLGWIERGNTDKVFESNVLKMQTAGVAPLIERDSGYEIVKVEEYRPATPKELSSVKEEIEAEIRRREAPAYTSALAFDLSKEWEKGERSFDEIAKEKKLTIESTSGLLEKLSDPSPALKGLTAMLFEDPSQTRQLIELKDHTVLVEVTQYEEIKLPGFAEVKAKLLEAYRKEAAQRLAKEDAQKAADLASGEPIIPLKDVAKELHVKVEEQKNISKAAPGKDALANPEIREAILKTYAAPASPDRYFTHEGRYVVLQVTSLTPPTAEEIKSKLDTYRPKANSESAEIFVEAMLNRMKAHSEIDVSDTILAGPDSEPYDVG